MTEQPLCPCGSGLPRYELIDAAGIFCCFVCNECEPKKRESFRPEIFDGSHPYASSGDEDDLFTGVD